MAFFLRLFPPFPGPLKIHVSTDNLSTLLPFVSLTRHLPRLVDRPVIFDLALLKPWIAKLSWYLKLPTSRAWSRIFPSPSSQELLGYSGASLVANW